MLRNFCILCLTACLTACNSGRSNLAENFIRKFKSINPDTLKVYSDEEYTDYHGTEIDSAETVFFPKPIADAHFAAPPGIFACYRFEIDKAHLGLIARTPSAYDASSIKFFIFDSKTNSMSNGIELAENFGSIVDGVQKTAWIYKKDNKPQAFIWIRKSNSGNTANPNDIFSKSVDKFCVLDLSKTRSDTLDTNAKELTKTFKKQLREAHFWRE